MLGIGLGANTAPSDFDVMSAITTGLGLNGLACGKITDPVPGDFYPVSNIDDMLFAFDSLNPDPGVDHQGPVCRLQVCPEARHNFVLDRSIKVGEHPGLRRRGWRGALLGRTVGKTFDCPRRTAGTLPTSAVCRSLTSGSPSPRRRSGSQHRRPAVGR